MNKLKLKLRFMEIKKTIIICRNANIHGTFAALNLSFFLHPS